VVGSEEKREEESDKKEEWEKDCMQLTLPPLLVMEVMSLLALRVAGKAAREPGA
jgi:hypothetical protein